VQGEQHECVWRRSSARRPLAQPSLPGTVAVADKYSLTTKNTTRVTIDLASMSLPWPMVDAAWPWLMATVWRWVDDGKGISRSVTDRAWRVLLIASLRSEDAKGEEGERTIDACCCVYV
jgi:hypothetical protein